MATGNTDDKYASMETSVTLTAVGAASLQNVCEGDSLSFMWKRGERFFLSEPASAFPDGAVYWDAVSVQTCRLRAGEGASDKKYVKLFVQRVPVGPDGLPMDYGETIAAGYLDLGKYAGHVDGDIDDDVEVILRPAGVLRIHVQVDEIVEDDGTHSEDVSSSSQCVTPTFGDTFEDSLQSDKTGGEGGKGYVGDVGDERPKETPDSPLMSNSVTISSASTASYGPSGHTSGRSLEAKLRRVTRQCEEARARAFSEASVALQRGIEIDNLKRAKDVLLKRLETAEQQLMTMMKQELAMTIQQTDRSSATLLGMDAIIQQLADTKVALAEKEFEAMEMRGQLKGRDAHIEALLMHLNAVKASSLMMAKSSGEVNADAVVNDASAVVNSEVDNEAAGNQHAKEGENNNVTVTDLVNVERSSKTSATDKPSVRIHVSAA